MQGTRSRIHAVVVRAALVKRLVEAEFRLAEVSRQQAWAREAVGGQREGVRRHRSGVVTACLQ